MAKSRLSKLLSQNRVRQLVADIAEAQGARVAITDVDGAALWGTPPEGERCAIRVSDNLVGWVIASTRPQTIARALEIVAADDLEKRELAREGVQKYRELAVLYDVSGKISSCLKVADIVQFVYEEVRNIVRMGEPLLLLEEDRGGLVDPREHGPDSAPLIRSCRAFVTGIIDDAKAEIVNNPRADPRFADGGQELPALMAVPLIVKQTGLGALLLLSDSGREFGSEDLHLLAGFGTLCAAALEKARLYERVESESRLRANFQRYLSPTIVDDIIANRTEISLGGKSVECSILFSDICGFTSMSERQTPEAIVQLLNEYFSAMSNIIFRYGGTLDKFIGDAVMAVFGAPFASADGHRSAICVALEMHQALHRLRWKWEREGRPQILHRIGISTGAVVAGNIGSDRRMDYTVIGDPVNVASRMEGLSPAMGTLISEQTFQKVRDEVIAFPLTPARVKGKEAPVTIHTVLGMRSKGGPGAPWMTALPVELLEEDLSAPPHQGVLVRVENQGAIVQTSCQLQGNLSLRLRRSFGSGEPKDVSLCAQVAGHEAISDECGPGCVSNRLEIEWGKNDRAGFASAGFLGIFSEGSNPRMEV